MFDAFWQFAREYDEQYRRSGDPGQQEMECDGAQFEVRISMGIPRAKMRLTRRVDLRDPAAEAAIRDLAERNGLSLDYRDASWVMTGEENLYYGRLRSSEVWFTPEKFEDRRSLLAELTKIYETHGVTAERAG